MRTILVIEDDTDLAEAVELILVDEGYRVIHAGTRKDAILQLKNNLVDLCLLDVRLPDGNGYDLCAQIRDFYQGSILMLTALDNPEAIVKGLQSGADDYVVKPFHVAELLARIEALFRRTMERIEPFSNTVFSGDLTIYMQRHQIYKGEERLELTNREYLICEMLLMERGNIVTRDKILERIWDDQESYTDEGTLNVHVSRLRKKLGTYEGKSYLETIKGFGYRWVFPVIQN